MNDKIYLDYNATAPAKPAVIAAVEAALRHGGNPSSVHERGRAARALVEEARRSVAALVGAEPAEIVFTSGGTEANNQALRACGRRRVIVSAIEHDAVRRAVPDPVLAPVTADGVVDLAALERLLAADREPALLAVMLANNETGVIQPVAEAAAIAHRHGALVHCDAIQAPGKIPVDVAALGADSYALSAHKLAGPPGVGALVVRRPGQIGRFIHGGGQERGLRAGTENVPGIAGFGVAAQLALADLPAFGRLAELRDELEARVRAVARGVVIFGARAPRLPNTSKLTMPGVSAETQVIGLDLAGIAVSAGSACSSGSVEPPFVLTAMGVPDAIALTAVRVSLGWGSTRRDVDRFVAAWSEIFARAGKRAVA
jgi:cysteine desulfurase